MAKVTEIKFFHQDDELYIALFANSPAFWCNEFWLKNVKATDYGIKTLPPGIELETKYNPETLGFDNLEADNSSYELQEAGNNVAGMAVKALFGLSF